MNGIILFLAAGLGIQHGWTQTDDGSVEYILQVDEASLGALQDGLPLVAAVPSEVGRIDRVRIQIGEGPVPRAKIVNNKPAVVRANFDELSTSELSEAAKQFAGSIKEIPASLKSDTIDSLVNSTDGIANKVSEQARLVLSRAADEIPVLAQYQPPTQTDNGWMPQGNTNSSTSTTAQPTAAQQQQQPRVRPASQQQNTTQFNGQQTSTGSTMDSSNSRQSSFGQPAGYNQYGYNQNGYTQTADAGNADAGKSAGTNNDGTNFNGQQNPNDTRQIGPYQPNQTQTQTQPGYPNREQYQQSNQTASQQPATNSSLDSRNGQTTIQRQPPDYQSAFSADNRNPRNNNFDMYAEQNNGNNLEPVSRPSPGTQAGNGSTFNNQANSQFNSGYSPPNSGQTYTRNQQQTNQIPSWQQQYGTSQNSPWQNWGTNGQANTNPNNPYQFGFNPLTGLPVQGSNPYAPSGFWNMQSLSPSGGYNPYSTTRGIEKEAELELEKRDKRIDELVNAVEKLQKGNDKITPASNELGSNLPKTEPVKPSTQWATLLIFLFGSIGANFYLAWIALSFYHRYRTLSEDMRDSLSERIETR